MFDHNIPKQRHVFFSFHFENDAWRFMQVKNSQQFLPNGVEIVRPHLGDQVWEEVKKYGNKAVKQWIDGQMSGTSVTAVLIGSDTYRRPWVLYEIEKTLADGKGLLGIYVHNLKDQKGNIAPQGENPFDYVKNQSSSSRTVAIYTWDSQKSPSVIGDWVNEAAVRAGR